MALNLRLDIPQPAPTEQLKLLPQGKPVLAFTPVAGKLVGQFMQKLAAPAFGAMEEQGARYLIRSGLGIGTGSVTKLVVGRVEAELLKAPISVISSPRLMIAFIASIQLEGGITIGALALNSGASLTAMTASAMTAEQIRRRVEGAETNKPLAQQLWKALGDFISMLNPLEGGSVGSNKDTVSGQKEITELYKKNYNAIVTIEEDKIKKEWTKLGGSELGQRIKDEANRKGLSAKEVLDLMEKLKHLNYNEFLALLQDGGLHRDGGGGGKRPPAKAVATGGVNQPVPAVIQLPKIVSNKPVPIVPKLANLPLTMEQQQKRADELARQVNLNQDISGLPIFLKSVLPRYNGLTWHQIIEARNFLNESSHPVQEGEGVLSKRVADARIAKIDAKKKRYYPGSIDGVVVFHDAHLLVSFIGERLASAYSNFVGSRSMNGEPSLGTLPTLADFENNRIRPTYPAQILWGKTIESFNQFEKQFIHADRPRLSNLNEFSSVMTGFGLLPIGGKAELGLRNLEQKSMALDVLYRQQDAALTIADKSLIANKIKKLRLKLKIITQNIKKK